MVHLLYAPCLSLLILLGLYVYLRRDPPYSEESTGTAWNRDRVKFALSGYLLLVAGLLVPAILIGGVTLPFTITVLAISPVAFYYKIPSWVFSGGMLLLLGGFYYQPLWHTPEPTPITRRSTRPPAPTVAERLRYEENLERVAHYSAPAVQNAALPKSGRFPALAEIESPLLAPPYHENHILLKIDYDAAYFGEEYVTRKAPPTEPRNVLSNLHRLRTKQFAKTMGFGVRRMPPPQDIDDPRNRYPNGRGPLPDEYTPADQFELAVRTANKMQIDWTAAYAPRRNDVDAHLRSKLSFLNPSDWETGASQRESRHASSHAFYQLPTVIDRATRQLDEWRMTQLELVSLLKHETPRVYVDRMLPNMAQLKSDSTPTRDLDRFEHKSLRFLQEGYDVVIEEQDDRLRMFGSLRASQQCLQCHAVPQNTLLGAFAYELRQPATKVSQN